MVWSARLAVCLRHRRKSLSPFHVGALACGQAPRGRGAAVSDARSSSGRSAGCSVPDMTLPARLHYEERVVASALPPHRPAEKAAMRRRTTRLDHERNGISRRQPTHTLRPDHGTCQRDSDPLKPRASWTATPRRGCAPSGRRQITVIVAHAALVCGNYRRANSPQNPDRRYCKLCDNAQR
jgi:hypothetical protein